MKTSPAALDDAFRTWSSPNDWGRLSRSTWVGVVVTFAHSRAEWSERGPSRLARRSGMSLDLLAVQIKFQSSPGWNSPRLPYRIGNEYAGYHEGRPQCSPELQRRRSNDRQYASHEHQHRAGIANETSDTAGALRLLHCEALCSLCLARLSDSLLTDAGRSSAITPKDGSLSWASVRE